ncbi:PREDICTED: receptor-type tyrosine-protein phosphatase H [Myotis brandtii]|uniref:receptor-type tyrosine-protein phosphatase H n=1 Tax=Myotis brandtii TaxID=109478 RepID=UPI000703DE39|nr:PREDICTED: receptor-type tyrosine-protein phosphatase H [Myotis brandtii]
MWPQSPRLIPSPVPSSAPNPVRDLTVESWTNISITLRWESPDPQSYTYWVQCTKDDGKNETWNTTDVTYTVQGLTPATSYLFSLWAEKHGVPSSVQTQEGSTAPNPVRDLTVGNPTTSSITLRWGPPPGPDWNYTYWVQCTGDNGKNETKNTTDVTYTVQGLTPATSYLFSVWAEKHGVPSSVQTQEGSTALSGLSLGEESPAVPPPGLCLCGGCPPAPQSHLGLEGRLGSDSLLGSPQGLCVWTGAKAAAPNATVRNLNVWNQTSSSITLGWEPPEDPSLQNHTYTYWVRCSGDGCKDEPQNTTDVTYTAEGLEPASRYEFSVWVEEGGANSSKVTLNASTAPNPVSKLTVESWTNISITLRWESPDPQSYTYWVQCTKDDGKNETWNTTDVTYTVQGLTPATSYLFSLWAEKHGVPSSVQTQEGSTAPNPVRDLTVESQTTSSISLRWGPPHGPERNYTYWVEWTGGRGQTGTQSTTDTSVTVDGLEPGSAYELAVWVENGNISSSRTPLSAATAPNHVRSLSSTKQTTGSITLSWEAPEDDDPDRRNYTYWVEYTGGSSETKKQSAADTHATVEGLEPGTLYMFSVWAEKNAVPGSRQNLSVSTVPNAVTSLGVQDQTTSSITLSWTAPQGPDHPPYTYWVSWTMEGGVATGTQNTPDTRITVNAMEAGTLYTFTVWAERNGVSSSNETRTGATAPNEVTALQKETQTNNSIALRWEAPADPRSQLYIYCVQWAGGGPPQGEGDPQGHQVDQIARTKETWYVVKGLEPGTPYNFSVWAERSDVAGSTQSLRASTYPDPVTSISCNSIPGGYGVTLTWTCPLGGYEAFELQVGWQQVSGDRASCGKGFSVWDLQPAQSYEAKVRTIWDGLRAPAASVTCHTESAGVIAGAVVGVLLFLTLVGLLIFFLRRYKKGLKEPAVRCGGTCGGARVSPRDTRRFSPDTPSLGGPPLAPTVSSIIPNAHTVHSWGPTDLQGTRSKWGAAKGARGVSFGEAGGTLTPCTPPLPAPQHLAMEGQGQSQTVASAPENSAKNRYRNVLPYDWSRVPLRSLGGAPGSDYINASFMPGLWSPREFIATQGPLPQTVGDFWRLVWEQQSHTLVMLTNCMELGRVKCEHYWPLDAQPCTHGHLQVTLEGEKVMENWTVRDLKLRHAQEQKTLSVRQFHYVAWPDHGVPHSPDPLLAFWKVLRQWLDKTPEGGPPIVHCSAGVGRTGTLIALDVLLRQLECEGVVGPYSFVKKMRESRPLMVQTEAQYVFLHQCLLRFLQQSAPPPVQKNEAVYENLLFENDEAVDV